MPVIKIKKCLTCSVGHEWIFDSLRLKELRTIKKLTGMNAKDFSEEADNGDPDAIAAIVYVMHQRDKITVDFDDVDLDFTDFSMELTDEEQAEQDALEKRAQRAAEKGRAAPKAPKT